MVKKCITNLRISLGCLFSRMVNLLLQLMCATGKETILARYHSEGVDSYGRFGGLPANLFPLLRAGVE